MAYKRTFSKSNESDSSSETSIELGKLKQVTVRKFNNVNLIDIREFYTDSNGDKKPGKKGIALTEELWFKLLESKDEIQQCLDDLNGKKKAKVDEKKEEKEEEEEAEAEKEGKND